MVTLVIFLIRGPEVLTYSAAAWSWNYRACCRSIASACTSYPLIIQEDAGCGGSQFAFLTSFSPEIKVLYSNKKVENIMEQICPQNLMQFLLGNNH